ncbi:MAG: diaminopimelate epimerase [bacterium]
MQKNINFTKMNGTGNDFIVFDNRAGIFKGDEADFFKQICTRKFSVGADGILFVDEKKGDTISMRYFNSDGKEADMCGNGGRCVALFARIKNIIQSNSFVVKARDGLHPVSVQKDGVRLSLNPTSEIRTGFNLVKEEGLKEGGYIEVGVPHYVIFADRLEQVQVIRKAPFYRNHKIFPQGVNVNYVHYSGDNQIQVRTYERGVEDETLSCGTGCVASALIYSDHFRITSPVHVITRGGELMVEYGESYKKVFLIGKAEVVYEGVLGY